MRAAVRDLVALENQSFLSDENVRREFFVAFYNHRMIENIRPAIKSENVGKLISISGTVTRSSEVKPELLYGHFNCKKCGAANTGIEQQFQFTMPFVCKTPNCTSADYHLDVTRCTFVDSQMLKLQENADEIPSGGMPRSLDVVCRNEIVESAKAGDKIVLTGFVAVIVDGSLSKVGESAVSAKTMGRGDMVNEGLGGLKRLGVKQINYKLIFVASSVTLYGQLKPMFDQNDLGHETQEKPIISDIPNVDKLELLEMLRTPNLYSKMVESICPSIFGHYEVKRGILLMLFGGVHKKTPEGISLRGDINVCIVGDPSCAKSQFLKYVHGFLPHTVYTSGKSSSAAGLTASVARDQDSGDHCIEAGALMVLS